VITYSAVTIQSHWWGSSYKAKSKETPPKIVRGSHRNIAEDCNNNSQACVMMQWKVIWKAMSSVSVVPASAANA
jgi:hypothetical protein